MVSGYFAYTRQNVKWYLRKAFQAFKIIAIAEVLYGLWYFLIGYFSNNGVNTAVTHLQTLLSHPIRIILCGTVFNGTLWYVYAAAWTWLVFYMLKRFGCLFKRSVFLCIIPLVLFQVFGKLYIMNITNISKNIFLFRNFVAFGLPMTLLGSYIGKNQERLLKMFTPLKAILLICGGGILSIVEYLIAHKLFPVSGMDFHISTVIISTGLFLLALGFPKLQGNPVLYIGQKLFMWVYLSHIFFGSLADLLYEYFGFSTISIMMYLKPIIVLAFSCGFALILNILRQKMKKVLVKKDSMLI